MLATFFHIIRWKRLLYFFLLLFLLKFSLINGFGFTTALSFLDLGMLLTSGALTMASGYLLSYFYRKQKKKVKFPVKKAKKYAFLFAVIALTLGFLLAFKIQQPSYSSIFIIATAFTYFYAKKVRLKSFFTNLFSSFLKSFCILIVCWFDLPTDLSPSEWEVFFKLQFIIVIYVVVSFLNNIVREIIIDINNINFDNNLKHKTLPILLGRNRATNITLAITVFVCFIVFGIAVLYVKNTYLFTTIILLGTVPQLVTIYNLMTASSTSDFLFLKKISNFTDAMTILSMPIVSYFLKYVIN